MAVIGTQIAGVDLELEFPQSFSKQADILFPDFKPKSANEAEASFSLQEHQSGKLQLFENDRLLASNLDLNKASVVLINEVVRFVAENANQHIAIHAAAVCKNGINLVLPANTGAGKTSLSAWLVSQGYKYLTDELVLFNGESANFEALYRPLNIKTKGLQAVKPLAKNFDSQKETKTDYVTIWPADLIGERENAAASYFAASLFIFPSYKKNSQLTIEPLSSAQIGLELMACNVNARNFENHGFQQLSKVARQVPGIRLTYSSFDQLEPLLIKLIELITTKTIDNSFLKKLLNAAPANSSTQPVVENETESTIPAATIISSKKKLCIGMATYDDYDGVYFSAQAIRMYHPEVSDDTEVIVLDNHPAGKCASDLKELDKKIENYRYIPVVEKTGTAIRDMIFENANADYVLCIDCHVFVEPGSIKRLIDYFESDPQTNDLFQGPMYSDNLKDLSTHFQPVWNKGMYGVWGYDQRAKSIDAPPFEIPMQGLGLFACRKQSWPGFNKDFRGFGGEEGYIHEKFRQAGGRTLCLPFLRWMHRFARPMGVPYPINWQDRIRNYLIGFTELGLDTRPIVEHFNEHLNKEVTADVVRAFEQEFAPLAQVMK